MVVAAQLPFGMRYKIKAYPKDAREQFLFMTDLTLRGHAALRRLGVRAITAPTVANV